MLLVRPLLISLVVIATALLLSAARADAVRRLKRAMARRADRQLSSLAGEPCTVSGVWSSRRRPRSLSLWQQRPPVGREHRHRSRRGWGWLERAAALCAGGCRFESGGTQQAWLEKTSWAAKWSGSVGAGGQDGKQHDHRSATQEKLRDGAGAARPGLPSAGPSSRSFRSRLSRDLRPMFAHQEEGNASLNTQAPPDSSTHPAGLTAHHALQLEADGDQKTPTGILEGRGGEEEVEVEVEVEALPVDSASLRQTGLPTVPAGWMTALYFSGRQEQLKLNPATGLDLPRERFTLELWLKPEGGQGNPAVLAGVFDNCSQSLSDKGWSVGIRAFGPSSTKDARFYFTLRTDRSAKATTIYSHQRYRASAWTHLVATYNGLHMSIYTDGAKVGESSLQTGNLYSPYMKACRNLFLGSSQAEQGSSFRGLIGGLVLWDYERSHMELLKGPLQTDPSLPVLAMWADFLKVDQIWTPTKAGLHPAIVPTPVPEAEVISPYLPPPCGLTPCDNTDIISSYNCNWQLRTHKRVRYRIVNLCSDDGGNPTVSEDQIRLQHLALTEAFQPYNITFDLSVHNERNTSLRQQFILSNCQIEKIGNHQCNPECDHPRTGHDGGDCLRQGPCYAWKRQDGVCNMECNSIQYDYDDGDCCDTEVTDVVKTCFDPESPDRAYMSVKELKEELHLSGADTLNVFFASNSVHEELAGTATWPWAKEALSHQGGMVLNPAYFGTVNHRNTMIHEMGHILGLYHVFKGVSERDSCDDPCQETTASMETGDLCEDTAPMPKSKACQDPGAVNDSCGVKTYRGTPYSNYMSYTDDNCTNHFTPNQMARMHCYLDLVYQNWMPTSPPASIPLAPAVTAHSLDSVSIHWLPPMRGRLYQSSSAPLLSCGDCTLHSIFHQYAYQAASPRVCDTLGYWSPDEAVGPPDVEQPCEPSFQAWSSDLSLFDTNVTAPCPDIEGCTLTLSFLHPVVPHALTLWVTYITSDNPAVADIELIGDGGQSIHLGPQHVFCDMPLTIRLDTGNTTITAVKLCTFDEKLEIDAVMLSSGPGSPLCSSCSPLRYRVERQPAFSRAPQPQTQHTFTDSSVQLGVKYQYVIQVETEGLLSRFSPPLVYTHGQAYCGDGLLQGSEGCDDGNLLDGDGCSKKCLMETGFNCKGAPSQCYVFDGDGVCEDFERSSSVQDCGYFTPLGYSNQWASTAAASHQHPERCPAHAATGEPSLTQPCRFQHLEVSEQSQSDAWFPCTVQPDTNNDLEYSFWLKVGFDHPGVAASVLVYLASDGSWSSEQCRRTVTILLSDTSGTNHSLVAVSGVALRTSCHFSTFALTGCLQQPCQMDGCSPPQLQHATVRCSGWGEASRCSIQCHHGYSISVRSGRTAPPHQIQAHLQCLHGSWDQTVSCQPTDCGLPHPSYVYHAVFSCPRGTTFGKQCSFTCQPPAILQGDSDRLVCLEDGLWSFPEAYCKIECPQAPSVPSARVLKADCLSSRHDVGSVCRYKCSPGFYVRGSLVNKTPRKYFQLACLESGQWEEAACEAVSCPALPDVFQGMYTCTNGLFYDTRCTLRCQDQAENREIRCDKDGKWTAEFHMCSRIQGPCPPPPDLNSVEYSCDQGTDVGSLCFPACLVTLDIDLRDPVVLPNGTSADAVKHWMLPSKVSSIVCTGMMKWFPDPQHIHCIQSCEPFGADGWCDTINNRAYCQYDEGDCCPSTLSTRKVVQFGADCNQDECRCRDPNAEENKAKSKQMQDAGGGVQ